MTTRTLSAIGAFAAAAFVATGYAVRSAQTADYMQPKVTLSTVDTGKSIPVQNQPVAVRAPRPMPSEVYSQGEWPAARAQRASELAPPPPRPYGCPGICESGIVPDAPMLYRSDGLRPSVPKPPDTF